MFNDNIDEFFNHRVISTLKDTLNMHGVVLNSEQLLVIINNETTNNCSVLTAMDILVNIKDVFKSHSHQLTEQELISDFQYFDKIARYSGKLMTTDSQRTHFNMLISQVAAAAGLMCELYNHNKHTDKNTVVGICIHEDSVDVYFTDIDKVKTILALEYPLKLDDSLGKGIVVDTSTLPTINSKTIH